MSNASMVVARKSVGGGGVGISNAGAATALDVELIMTDGSESGTGTATTRLRSSPTAVAATAAASSTNHGGRIGGGIFLVGGEGGGGGGTGKRSLRKNYMTTINSSSTITRQRYLLVLVVCCVTGWSFFPLLFFETAVQLHHNSHSSPYEPGAVVLANAYNNNNNNINQQQQQPAAAARQVPSTTTTTKTSVIKNLKEITIWDDPVKESQKPLGRGISGRPMEQTPALLGAKRAHVECDVNVDSLAYWNDPTGTRDDNFDSPFSATTADSNNGKEKFITFSPDKGGWNNIRMSMEIIFVLAAVTGRTLVLPPKEPFYLLRADKQEKHRGFADFFPIATARFQQRVKVITMQEFVTQQLQNNPQFQQNMLNGTATAEHLMQIADHCDHRQASDTYCGPIFDLLRTVGYIPEVAAATSCLVFDQGAYETNAADAVSPETADYVADVCGTKRATVYFSKEWNRHDILHFPANENPYRLLTHFYGMIHFTDPVLDNYYKRFVRDYLHYHDAIYCAAGKIVKALQQEGIARGFRVDPMTGAGGYSALHVRRGDLQYQKVKIPAEEWYENTKELWQPHEILYIATDEKDKNFFAPLAEHYDLRFLGDYWDLAGLSELDPNYMGMIDTIIASRGRVFCGTFFSTFTGYINRLRGYHGMSMMDSWYGWLPRKEWLHKWERIRDDAYAYEWPDGWMGIDADVFPTRDKF